MIKKYLILGSGYTAQYLKPLILSKTKDCKVFETSRSNSSHILFDLSDPTTWGNIPKVDGTYWLFPASPEDVVQSFLKEFREKLGKLVVVGSTSRFSVTKDHEEVNEAWVADNSMDRVKGEEYIRSQKGIVVCASGIYGPNRNPKSWVEKGYVAPSDKYLNLIHVEDLSQILIAAMDRGDEGLTYIASDNNPNTWNNLISFWKKTEGITLHGNPRVSKVKSKKINSSQTLGDLKVQLKYPNIIK